MAVWSRDAIATMAAIHERWAPASPEIENGFAEHVPMGAEALLSLGADPAAVRTWVSRHTPMPLDPASPIAASREVILGELAAESWREVVARRVPQLVPSLGAHLFHGLIRTGHAVRALGRSDEEPGRQELATALAAWQVWAAGEPRRAVSPDEPAARAPLDAVAHAARRGAAHYLDKPSILTLHEVTGPMAYLLIAPYLGEAEHRAAVDAFALSHRRAPNVADVAPDAPVVRAALDIEAVAQLTGRWDAHPAKLAEASVRAAAITRDPIFAEVLSHLE
jgi:hypothetical protein